MKRLLMIALAVSCLGLSLGCGEDTGSGPTLPKRSVGPDWMQHGMLAGMALYAGMSEAEIDKALTELVEQHVDVVIADSALSDYQTDAQWDVQMALIRRVVDKIHQRGMKVVVYLTTLEVQTVDGRLLKHSMYKDHPEWAQVAMEGRVNVFYGNQEDWVLPDDESAWLCPISGYRDYLIERVKKLVATKVDGIWADVPTYMDTAVKWSCTCPLHRARFKKDTGIDLPKDVDWTKQPFRRWVSYRHEELRDFQKALADAARSVNPEVQSIFEIFSTDTLDCTETGLDASYMGNNSGISHVWEIDSVSNEHGMLRSTPKDWISKLTITKYAKGADKGRPTWVFAYGNTDWDAEMVFATALSAQANPYETKTPEMARTVGAALRTRLFKWVEPHKKVIYDSTHAARVAVLYSAESRDFIDAARGYAFGMFTDYDPPVVDGTDPKTGDGYTGPDRNWWATSINASAEASEHLAEYRGFSLALAQLHVPYAIETMQHQSAAALAKYDLVVAPNLVALSDAQAQILRDYVQGGGQLLVTGPAPFSQDGYGTPRADLALADLLGFGATSIPAVDATSEHVAGKGTVTHVNSYLGRSYLRTGSTFALATIDRVVRAKARTVLRTDAHRDVYLDVYEGPDALLVHLLNFVGVGHDATMPAPQSVTLTVRVPPGKQVVGARLSSPDTPDADAPLTPEAAPAGFLRVTVPLKYYALLLVELEDDSVKVLGAAKVKVSLPNVSGALTATVHAVGPDGERSGARALSDTNTATLEQLRPGKWRVYVEAQLGARLIGQGMRVVAVAAGQEAEVSLGLGVDLASGPATPAATVGDRFFFFNSTAAAVQLTVAGKTHPIAAKQAFTLPLDQAGSLPFSSSAAISGAVNVAAAAPAEQGPTISKLSIGSSTNKGFAGHAIELTGKRFGSFGRLHWGGEPCVVTFWSDEAIFAYLPDTAAPATRALTVEVAGTTLEAGKVTVETDGVTRTKIMTDAFAFVRDKMRSPLGGVFTNYVDVDDPITAELVYPNGHHQTAEHTGLFLWMSAAMMDHASYEQTFQFLRSVMVSPKRGIVNWAVNKTTNQPMLQEELNSNAPLDDFRVVKGLFAGWDIWGDRRYLELALRIGRGLYETSVATEYPTYAQGIIAYGHNWDERQGYGKTDIDPIPVDYSDLYVIKRLSVYDARWLPVLGTAKKFLLDAQIATNGQFWNSYTGQQDWSGDFEYRNTQAGLKIKTIQSLWSAIHLARVGETAAAQKALDFYMSFYKTHQRIAEYYEPNGGEPAGEYFKNKLKNGEPRIYSQVARLALYLGGSANIAFAKQVLAEKIESDVVTTGPVAGHIGKSADQPGDASAYNVLEALIGLTLAQGAQAVSN